MDEKRNARFSPPAVGGISLLAAFAVLCLTVFALRSLTTVQADVCLADASAQAVKDYYAADCATQEILARLRGGETPVEVESHSYDSWHRGTRYTYACPISGTQELEVEVIVDGEDYEILRWQAPDVILLGGDAGSGVPHTAVAAAGMTCIYAKKRTPEASFFLCSGQIFSAGPPGFGGGPLLVDGGETALFDGDLSVDHGIVHRSPQAHCGQHTGGIVLPAHQLQAAGVHQEEIGAFSHRQRADILSAQQAGAALGGHL